MNGARIHDIVSLAANSFNVKGDLIKGPRGNRLTCRARLAVYHIAKLNGHSNAKIGQILGGRDPSTVVDGAQSCRALMVKDDRFRASVERLIERADALPRYVMEPRGKIYKARIVPRRPSAPLKPFVPIPKQYFGFISPAKRAVVLPDDPALDDVEWLSRRVAAHYEGARA